MSMSARYGKWMIYQRKVEKMNINNGVNIHFENSFPICRIYIWVYGVMDTMFPPLLISNISDFSIVGKSILNSE